MPGIREWLSSHGLSDYADRFVENRIDLSVLPDLTDEDLKELGVFLGDRRRILRLIAELGPTSQVPDMPGSRRPDEAERRQVTVMFADLVGSTALSIGMDPEDLREVFAAYSSCVEETVSKFGGNVAQYMGDGIMVYFGYPHAHEDDAERAVRAGLELIAAVAGLKTRDRQQVRVGIATGVVVVGNLTPSIVGETPNLAARLQSIAKPNMVVISEGTRRLLGHLFELEDLGTRDLKGIAAPVQVWAVLRPSSSTSRFEALHPSGMRALVGREEEYELLRRRWSKAKEGRRPSRAAVRRGRYRKITPNGRVYRTSHGRALTPHPLFLLPAAHQQRALSYHRPCGTFRRICARRSAANETRQTR